MLPECAYRIDVETSRNPETGEFTIGKINFVAPYPKGLGAWMLETKYNKNWHGSIRNLTNPRLPVAHLIKDWMKRREAYHKNLVILWSELIKKVTQRLGGCEDEAKLYKYLGKDFMDAWVDLENFLWELPEEPYREGYLTDIFRYWRECATGPEIRRFEELWVYVAGRPHLEE